MQLFISNQITFKHNLIPALHFQKTEDICAKRVIVAVPQKALEETTWKRFEDVERFLSDVDSVQAIPAMTGYFIYNQTWWKSKRSKYGGLEKADVITDLPIGRVKYLGESRSGGKKRHVSDFDGESYGVRRRSVDDIDGGSHGGRRHSVDNIDGGSHGGRRKHIVSDVEGENRAAWKHGVTGIKRESRGSERKRSVADADYSKQHLFMVANVEVHNVDYFDGLLERDVFDDAVKPSCNDRSLRLIRDINRQVGMVYSGEVRDEFKDKDGEPNIPLPASAVIHDWSQSSSGAGWYAWKRNVKWDDIAQRMLRPFPSEHVYIAGSTYCPGQCQFWAEGALQTVDNIITEHFDDVVAPAA